MVLGAEARTRSPLRPITSAASLVAPGVRGPGTTLGEVRRWTAGPAPQPSLGQETAQHLDAHMLWSPRRARLAPVLPIDGGSRTCPTPLVPVAGSLSALQTHFS